MKFKITDDSGFLALVNNDIYNPFFEANWDINELFSHFITQMNKQCFSIWRTSNEGGGFWSVEFVEEKSAKKSNREFSSIINVTNRKLYVANFEDLSMCASYPEYSIPLSHNSKLFYELDNGLYLITVRQLFNPDIENEVDINFEIVVKPKNLIQDEIIFDKIVWYE